MRGLRIFKERWPEAEVRMIEGGHNLTKERFKKDYDETSEALEWHIETLVNFGGDSTHKIYKAMIEVINDILNDVPSTDKDGMIEYLQEMI